MKTPLTAQYNTVLLPDNPGARDLLALREPYDAMIAAQFRVIVDRTEHSPLRPWLDTRLDLSTGRDLPATDPPAVSGWVQGRGLEGLAKFGAWLSPFAADPHVAALLDRTRRVTAALLERIGDVSNRYGHLYFAMLPDGAPLVPGEQGALRPANSGKSAPFNFSDLFACKGMFAAAQFLDDRAAVTEARSYCLAVYDAIVEGRFHNDQPQPASLTSVVSASGGIAHGPHMIALGIAAEFARHEAGVAATEMGLRLARRVLYGHVNLGGRWPALQPDDLSEFITPAGAPYADEAGRVISDPGHSLEFVGLLLKFSAAVRAGGQASPEQWGELLHMEGLMPAILRRAFGNGFRPATGGIIKSLDLVTRAPIDDTMPWWSLPETIRAGLGTAAVAASEETRAACLGIAAQCHNALAKHYVRPDVHLMAVKLRDAAGRVSDIVPAYPDADPGYHTALSLMDALALLPDGQTP